MLFSTINDNMGDEGTSPPQKKTFYGWIVVASCALILAVSFGIAYSFGVFFSSFEDEFGWSRAKISTVFSLYLFLSGVFSIVGVRVSNVFGLKIIVPVLGIIGGLSLFLSSQVDSAWQLYLTYSILLALGTGSMHVIAISTVSRWFVKERATSLSIVGAGASFGAAVIAPFGAWMITTYDWEDAFLILCPIAVALIVGASLFLKDSPDEIGAQPDGQFLSPSQSETNPTDIERNTLEESASPRTFWMLIVILLAYSFCFHMVISHIVPRAKDIGISPESSAGLLSALFALSLSVFLATSSIADVLGKKTTGLLFILLSAIAMFWLVDADETWEFYMFAVLFGIAYGGLINLITISLGDGSRLLLSGSKLGVVMISWGLGAAAGPYFGGLIFDRTDSYQFAFFLGGMIMMVIAILIWQLPVNRKTELLSE